MKSIFSDLPNYLIMRIIKEATQSDEFITKSQNKSYIGPYIETSNGRYFAGTNITKKGEEIIKLPDGSLTTVYHYMKNSDKAIEEILTKVEFEELAT